MPTIFSPISGTGTIDPIPVSPDSSDPSEYILERPGDRDLAFRGWVIGHATGRHNDPAATSASRCVSVTIFAVEGGTGLVGYACRWIEVRPRDGAEVTEHKNLECSTSAHRFQEYEELLEWLKADSGGKLGPTSKEAWVEACEKWEKLAGAKYERLGNG